MITCPNKNLPEWKELEETVPELAYTIWDNNNGYGIDKAPNGEPSKLFSDLLQHYNGDRRLAIQAKAKVFSNGFKTQFGDWLSEDKTNVSKVVDENGEPYDKDVYDFSQSNVAKVETKDENQYQYIVTDEERDLTPSGNEGLNVMTKPVMQGDNKVSSVLQSMVDSSRFFIDPFQKQIMESIIGNIPDNVTVFFSDSEDKFVMQYYPNRGEIEINKDAFKKYNNYTMGHAFLHELVHAYTISKYESNSIFQKQVDKLYEQMSEAYPENEYGRSTAFYGLKKPIEMISELYTNPEFRDVAREVVINHQSAWTRFINSIRKILGIKPKDGNDIKIINQVDKFISSRNVDMAQTTELYQLTDAQKKRLEDIDIDANGIITNLTNGLNARYKSLKSLKADPFTLAKIKTQIDNYQFLLQKEEDKKVLVDFVRASSVAFKNVLERIRNADNDPSLIKPQQLMQFKDDFLDFYGPVIDDINTKLFNQGYFDDLNNDDLKSLKDRMDRVTTVYNELKGKFDRILVTKAKEIMYQYGRQQGVPEDILKQNLEPYEIKDKKGKRIKIDPLKNAFNDTSAIFDIFRTTRNNSDIVLRTMFTTLSDINTKVQMFSNKFTQDLIRDFEANVTKEQILLYYEKDSKGKPTGNLVRDLNYGQFNKDYSIFLKDLDSRYEVIDGDTSVLDDNRFQEYVTEKNKWLSTHCERKFKPEYYEAYNKLTQNTRTKMNDINSRISLIVQQYADEKGPHLEDMSARDWANLDKLYKLKKNLSNPYDLDGNMKTGEDLETAEQLTEFYKEIGDGKIRSKAISQTQIIDLMEQKQKELSPEKFKLWKSRNISIHYTQEFVDALKNIQKPNYGEFQAEFDKLYEERRQLLNIGKENNTTKVSTSQLTEKIMNRIFELDNEISKFKAEHKEKGSSDFKKLAEIDPTPEYLRDKEAHIAMGDEEYQKWYNENHYFNGYKFVPASYYTTLVPKDDKYFELRLSSMNRELDKDSEMVNKNYNFEDPDYYQPKRSKYDNTKAFKEATKTKGQKKIYDRITKVMEESNDKIGFIGKKDKYKLPQITGDIVDFIGRDNNFLKGAYHYAMDGVVARQDDVEYSLDNNTLKANKEQLLFAPTHFINRLERPEYISRNLIGMLTAYANMAENYRLKNEYAGEFETIKSMLGKRTVDLRTKYNPDEKPKSGENTRNYKKYESFLKMQLYGQYKKPLSINFRGFNISITKIFDGLRSYASTSNLSCNMPALGKALVQGMDKSIVEALSDRYYSRDSYFAAVGNCILNTPRMIANLSNSKHDFVDLAMMEHNGISRSPEEKVSNLQYNRFTRFLKNNLFWGGWSIVDYVVKAPILRAIYSDYRYVPEFNKIMSRREYVNQKYPNNWKKGSKEFKHLNTFTMGDVYTCKGGKLVIKDKYKQYADIINDDKVQLSIKRIATFLTNRIDGILSKEDKTEFMMSNVGASIIMHRSFFIVNMEDNFLVKRQYNAQIEDQYEAKYQSGLRAIFRYLYNAYAATVNLPGSIMSKLTGVKREPVKENKQIDSYDAYNMRRITYQMAMYGVLVLLSSVWLTPWADDDDDWLPQYLRYVAVGSAFEEISEYNLFGFLNQVKSPSAMITPIETGIQWASMFLAPWTYQYYWSNKEITKGPYKGMEQWQKTAIKFTPGLRGVIESRDPKAKYQYFNTQIKK